MVITELRIGNLVDNSDGKICRVRNIDEINNTVIIQRVFNNNPLVHGVAVSFYDIKPIALTYNLLEKYGYLGLNFEYYTVDLPNGYFYDGDNRIASNIKFVHTLQNLFFALTGKEISHDTIKE